MSQIFGQPTQASLGGVTGAKASPYLGATLQGITQGMNFQQPQAQKNYLSGSFNPQQYLAQNPDVASAVQSGSMASPLYHYMKYGMAEGRAPNAYASGPGINFFPGASGAPYGFNEQWYLTENPDVAEAVRSGSMPSGMWHYKNFGMREGRAPSMQGVGLGYNQYSNPWMPARTQPQGMAPTSLWGSQYLTPQNMPWMFNKVPVAAPQIAAAPGTAAQTAPANPTWNNWASAQSSGIDWGNNG